MGEGCYIPYMVCEIWLSIREGYIKISFSLMQIKDDISFFSLAK